MNFQPDLVVDDARATGWARVEIYGDKEKGRALIATGRSVLGGLKAQTGTNQQQVESRETTGGGGFHHRWQTLSDGSKIHAMTNDGHDTIRIYTSRAVTEEKKPRKRPDDFDANDYLWVGVRVKDGCVRPHFALDVNLVEPDGNVMRGVVGTIFATTNGWIDYSIDYAFNGDESSGYSLERLPFGYLPSSIDDALAHMFARYHGGNPPFSPNMIYGDHQTSTSLLRDGSFSNDTVVVNWSFNGLMMQYWEDSIPGNAPPDTPRTQEFAQKYGPFDPLMSDAQNAGGDRTFAGMNTGVGGAAATGRFGWDAVFWLDPFDARVIAEHPDVKLDDRRLIQAFRQRLSDDGLLVAPGEQVQNGEYRLVVRAYDSPVHKESNRANEAIPLFAGHGRSVYCDYSDYMRDVGVWPPLQVEVEIRMGRSSITQRSFLPEPVENVVESSGQVFNFDLVAASYDDRNSATWPFGYGGPYDACVGDGGPNFGGPSYADTISINVKDGTAQLSSLPVPRVFGTAPFHASQPTERRRARFFIYGNVFPQPLDADWPSKAALDLYTAVESVTSGVYGCSEMAEFSQDGMLALFGSTGKDHVWMYDPVLHTLTDCGTPSSTPADWAVNDPPDDSAHFFWYYENAVPYQNACFHTYGVLVSSTGGFYEMDQNFVGTPGFNAPDCCTGT